MREDAVRQLKDRQDLFAGGADTSSSSGGTISSSIRRSSISPWSRAATQMCLHLTGTNFFEPITDPAFLATRPVWHLEVVSETPEIYRAEYLAFKMLG